jgi:D-glycero-D-manno-heptose 1,7-bisphosphate phosphatase
MIEKFQQEGINITSIYHCPHHPDFTGECECRKPKPGMIIKAKKEFDIDLGKSILVGDKNSDIEAGLNAGIKYNYLINTGHKIITNSHNMKILNNLRDLILLF